MTQIAPQPRERVEATERRRLTPREKAILLERQHDLCGGPCGQSLVWMTLDNGTKVYGPMIDEHVLPLGLAGSNDLSNRAMWCVDCAKAKTREDIKRIRKAQRLERDNDPETRRRSKFRLRGRGFGGKDPLR